MLFGVFLLYPANVIWCVCPIYFFYLVSSVTLLDGVADTGVIDLADVQLATYLAEKGPGGLPFLDMESILINKCQFYFVIPQKCFYRILQLLDHILLKYKLGTHFTEFIFMADILFFQ